MPDKKHIGFEALAKRVAEKYKGKKVKPKYQKEYGKTYSKEEAKEVGNKVAGKMKAQMMGEGGETKSEYKIVEGVDHYRNRPLYQIVYVGDNEDIEYDGEWHTDRDEAEKELKGLTESYAEGGEIEKTKSDIAKLQKIVDSTNAMVTDAVKENAKAKIKVLEAKLHESKESKSEEKAIVFKSKDDDTIYSVEKDEKGIWTIFSESSKWKRRNEYPYGFASKEDAIMIAKLDSGTTKEIDPEGLYMRHQEYMSEETKDPKSSDGGKSIVDAIDKALKGDDFWIKPDSVDAKNIALGVKKGWVRRISHTQAEWTDQAEKELNFKSSRKTVKPEPVKRPTKKERLFHVGDSVQVFGEGTVYKVSKELPFDRKFNSYEVSLIDEENPIGHTYNDLEVNLEKAETKEEESTLNKLYSIVAKAEDLIDYQSGGIHSQPKDKIEKYVKYINKEVSKLDVPFGSEIYDSLQDDNYHSLNLTLGLLGFYKNKNDDGSWAKHQEAYSKLVEVCEEIKIGKSESKKEIVGYAIVDPISGEMVVSKKTITELIEASKKLETRQGFEYMDWLVYEIIKKGDKNVLGDKVTSVDINLLPISKESKKTKPKGRPAKAKIVGIKAKFKVGDHVLVNYGEEKGNDGVIERVFSYESHPKSMTPAEVPYYEIKGVGKEIPQSNLELFKKPKADFSKIIDKLKKRKPYKGKLSDKDIDKNHKRDLKKDFDRTAEAPGKRISKDGSIYWEYRENRTDIDKKNRL